MGLGMYLTKKTYLGAQYEHNKISGNVEIFADGKKVNIQLNKVESIIESVGYWRKANHIHNWFVNNVQGGVDECDECEVSKEHFEKLLETCKEVLKDRSKANELLPTKSGFFFGGTEYDEYYFGDIQNTIDIILPIIEEFKDPERYIFVDYFYQSSW